jgi:hypothetical protein
MFLYLGLALDLVGIVVLAFGLYFRRHRRRDLVVAYLAVNVGVLGVSWALAQSAIAAGFGLGLFGILSIIRLRSGELNQYEIAYYFCALALGLLGGLAESTGWPGLAAMLLILAVMALADHPRTMRRIESAEIVLDEAIPDRLALMAHLERLLGGSVESLNVIKLDLVNDSTVVQVQYQLPKTAPHRERSAELSLA